MFVWTNTICTQGVLFSIHTDLTIEMITSNELMHYLQNVGSVNC